MKKSGIPKEVFDAVLTSVDKFIEEVPVEKRRRLWGELADEYFGKEHQNQIFKKNDSVYFVDKDGFIQYGTVNNFIECRLEYEINETESGYWHYINQKYVTLTKGELVLRINK
jgi:hypothetical protein